jgi:hypothetical protein
MIGSDKPLKLFCEISDVPIHGKRSIGDCLKPEDS